MKIIRKDILNSPILIVEDDFVGRTTLKAIFNKHGFTNVEEAENGRVGLEKISSFRPHLVILDVMMPEIDGIGCCKRIRSNPDQNIANIPVLFQTSLEGSIEKDRLFEAGATDYLSKPIDPNELAARAVVHLEQESMLKSLKDYKIRIASELDMARAAQRVLIPEKAAICEMEKVYSLDILGHYEACSELGGDFWGFKSISNEELAIYMVDFSGHGVNAALNVFRLHALMQTSMDIAHIPGAYLTHINAHLSNLLAPGQFATMFYGIINTKRNTLSYASAAVPELLLFRNDGQSVVKLESTGTVIGALKNSTYDMVEVEFKADDCLFAYSDALVETPDAKGNMWTVETLTGLLGPSLKKNKSERYKILDELLDNFKLQCLPNLKDDLTISVYFRRS